ncbi:MAG TPA: gliding motility protein GldN [Bacteroidaceae bacterium]|nr:gliding motility protein GldN [Bacteroidaceae bacterium]
MKRIYFLTFLFCFLLFSLGALSQPPRRILEQQQENTNSVTSSLSARTQAQYSAQSSIPMDAGWRRDIYREIDLNREKNAVLYFPVEPMGEIVNFFTLIFNLVLQGNITAYEYRLDGNELFSRENILDIKHLLDKFYIYYIEENGVLKVDNSDIPSGEVMRYFVKESYYLDPVTSTIEKRVTAICPVLLRNDFGSEEIPYPMFWLDYEELSPYLRASHVMTSSYNNTYKMSLHDYFFMFGYEGDIYKTMNLKGQLLAEYCENDSMIKLEQLRIEQELKSFEMNLWSSSESVDQIETSSDKRERATRSILQRENSHQNTTLKTSEERPQAQPKVSVRR